MTAGCMTSCATRLAPIPLSRHVPPTMLGSMMHPGRMIQAPLHLPQLQMLVTTGGDDADDSPEVSSWPADNPMMAMPTGRWKAEIKDTRISRQACPPTLIYGIDARKLLENWVDEFLDPFPDTVVEKAAAQLNDMIAENLTSLSEDDELPPPPKTHKIWNYNKAMVLHDMRSVILEATSIYFGFNKQLSRLDRKSEANLLRRSRKLEMVGLIPKDFDVSYLESGSSAVDLSVLALCAFSRERLKDDRRGSIRKAVEKQYGKRWTRRWWGRAKKEFDVFALEGLAEAPWLPSTSSRALLAKIENYAQKEQRIVVVPKWAYISSDGTDLSEYYVNLGFDYVQMDGQLHELIYLPSVASPSAADMFVEGQQIMVGMNLWAGGLAGE